MGVFSVCQQIFDAVTEELARRQNNIPLFPNYPGVNRAQAEKYIRDQLDLEENTPINYSEAKKAPEILANPESPNSLKLLEFIEKLADISRKCPDTEDPDLVLTNEQIEQYKVNNRIDELSDDDINLLRMQKYVFGAVDKYLKPPLDEEKLRRFIEKYPRNPGHPRHLTVISPEERAKREQQLNVVRGTMIKYFNYRLHIASEYDIDRPLKALLEYEDKTNVPAINTEIKTVFTKYASPEAENSARESMIADIMVKENIAHDAAEKKVADELATYPRRRAVAIIARVQKALAVFDDVTANYDMYMQPQLLGQTYWSLIEASSIIYESDSYSEIKNVAYTKEELELLKSCKSLQDKCGALVDKVANIANPCHLFLNIDELDNFNLAEATREYEENIENCSGTLGEHPDSFASFLDDKIHHVDLDRESPLSDEYDAIVNEYALKKLDANNKTPGIKVESYSEKYDEIKMAPSTHAPLLYGQPVAYQHGKRVVVFTRANETDYNNVKLEINKPEKLFNYMFGEKNHRLQDLMTDADPAYIHSSPQFREMKSVFTRITGMPKLSGHSLSEIAKYRKVFVELQTKSSAYLAYKGLNGKNNLEKSRIHVAQGLSEYAKFKIEQLELIENAALTLSRYYNLSHEERKALLDKENAIERMILDKKLKDDAPAQEKHAAEEHKQENPHAVENKNGINEAQDVKQPEIENGNIIIEAHGAENNEPENENPEPRRTVFVADENRVSMAAQFDEQNNRRKEPLKWLREASKKYADIEGVRSICNTHISTMENLNIIGRLFSDDNFAQMSGYCTAGAMLAGELVLRGREKKTTGIADVLETLLDGDERIIFSRMLGKQAMAFMRETALIAERPDYVPQYRQEFGNKIPISELTLAPTTEQYKEFIETFNAQRLSYNMEKRIAEIPVISVVLDFSKAYYESVKPKYGEEYTASETALRNFARQNIIGTVGKFAAPMIDDKSGFPNVSRETGRELLANCVLYSMVQLERANPDYKAPGGFEKMLLNPEKLRTLQTLIKESDDFIKLEQKVASPDKNGQISFRDYPEKILNEKLTAKLAKVLIIDAKIVENVNMQDIDIVPERISKNVNELKNTHEIPQKHAIVKK